MDSRAQILVCLLLLRSLILDANFLEDWEFPSSSADTANYVSLVQQMRSSFGSQYGISVTLPADYGDLQYYDAIDMQSSVNHFGFMAYDLQFYG